MTFRERVKKALIEDTSIMITKKELLDPEFRHTGFGTDHMQYLGLKKSDLKKLERAGLAVRSYKCEQEGNQTRWLLLIDSEKEG